MKKIVQLVVSLTAISAVCAAILATVNVVTKDQIASIRAQVTANAAKAVMGAVEKVAPLSGVEGAYRGLNAQGKVIAYAIVGRDSHGYGGDIALMVGFTPAYKIITYRKLEASETPGLGSNLTAESFAKQFTGMDASIDLAVKKDGGQVEAITSATITSRAVCAAINNARNTLRHHLRK